MPRPKTLRNRVWRLGDRATTWAVLRDMRLEQAAAGDAALNHCNPTWPTDVLFFLDHWLQSFACLFSGHDPEYERFWDKSADGYCLNCQATVPARQ